jgi:hypothetical protein
VQTTYRNYTKHNVNTQPLILTYIALFVAKLRVLKERSITKDSAYYKALH